MGLCQRGAVFGICRVILLFLLSSRLLFSSNALAQNEEIQSPMLAEQIVKNLLAQADHNEEEKRQIFVALLGEIKNFSFLKNSLDEEGQILYERFVKFNIATLNKINDKHLESRYLQFNNKYLSYLDIYYKIKNSIISLSQRKISTPLRNKSEIVELELKINAQQSSLKQAQYVIFDQSIEAHKSIERAVDLFVVKGIGATPPGTEKKKSKLDSLFGGDDDDKAPNDLPGTYLGSQKKRDRLSEEEKINLTPVDDVFYNSQLGKKLERDLGGKAEYWSYDFEQDELYVKVGNSVGKLRVREDTEGTRIIQTRVGSNFIDFPKDYKGDEKVDTLQANGKFLNGKGDTLFGRYPSSDPKLIGEDELKHTDDDGHNHDHHHHE